MDGVTQTIDTLSYDGLNRLTQAVIGNPGLPLNVTKTVTYDAIGNITSKSDVGDYAYDPVHVHAVSGIAPGATGTLTATFTYDGDGNLLTGKGRTLAWTSFDMVSQITQGANTLAFTYDSGHARLKEASSDGSTKYYLNDPISGIIEEKAIGASLAVSWNDYVMRGGEMVALHVTAASPQVRYFHKDHLGSIVALTDESGAVVERDSYDAWGARRNPSGPDDPLYPSLSLASQVTRGYTGHEQLDQVGLVHMNGRIYDPVIGKMMSADPTVPNPIDGQSYNRYAYVGNNPLSFTDPTGFMRDPPRGIQSDPGNHSTHLDDHPAHGKICDCTRRDLARMAAGDVLGLGLNIQTASSFGAYPVGPRSIPPITEEDILDGLGDLIGMVGAIAESNPEIPEAPLALKGIRALDEIVAAEKAALAARRAAQLAKNKVAGTAWEDAVAVKKAEEGQIVGRQITIETQTTRGRVDILTKDPTTAKVGCTECKASETAPLTGDQERFFHELKSTGGTIKGAGKPSFPGGTRLGPTPVGIERPTIPAGN